MDAIIVKESWYQRNKEAVKLRSRQWALDNPEKRKAILQRSRERHRVEERERGRKRRQENPKKELERLKKWQRRARKERPAFVLKTRLRNRLRHAFKSGLGKKNGSTLELVGCSFEELRAHIERQFTRGMSWERISEIEIDHRIPCAAFDLADPSQQRSCFHFSNLRPLWKSRNRAKGARLDSAEQVPLGI
jgi:hypothetical protein